MLNGLQRACLKEMGIDVWVRRKEPVVADSSLPDDKSSAAGDPQANGVPGMGWEELEQAVAACQRCELHQSRTRTVFGVGNQSADWLIVGEAPGAEEDRQGEPFVGRAGMLLNSMIRAIGLERNQVFIANILKCRPPKNRDPAPGEVACCQDYLNRQIELIRPKIILALGRVAAQNLLNCTTPIGRMRGQRYEYGAAGIPVIVTYHPAYLLRSPREKRKVWHDLLLADKVCRESC